MKYITKNAIAQGRVWMTNELSLILNDILKILGILFDMILIIYIYIKIKNEVNKHWYFKKFKDDLTPYIKEIREKKAGIVHLKDHRNISNE
jgi:hypothetical protein